MPASWTAALADEIEWHEADGGPYGGVYHGPDQVAGKVLGPLSAGVPDFVATPEQMIPSARTVAVGRDLSSREAAPSRPATSGCQPCGAATAAWASTIP